MPKAISTETELKELTNGKALKALKNTEITPRLKEIHTFLAESCKELQPEVAQKVLKSNGFLQEITRDCYIGTGSPQAVQVLAAAVVVGVCDVTAPEFVFPDEKVIMQFVLRQFHHLEKADKDSGTYQLMYYVVETVAKTGLFTLLAEVRGGDELTAELFDICINKLAAAAEANKDVALSAQLEQLLKGIIEEMREITEELLGLLLGPLSIGGKSSKMKSAAGMKLVKSVIRRLETPVLQTICTYVTKSIDSLDASLTTSDKSEHNDILKKMRANFVAVMTLADTHQHLATTLLPVMAHRLSHPNLGLRQLTTNSMCRVFEMHTTYYSEYPILFNATMKKFRDKSKDVRVGMIDWASRFLPKHRDTSVVVGEALVMQFLDSETEVRKAAVKAVTTLAQEESGLLDSKVLEEALDRIRDKKSSVRSFAMSSLSEMYADCMAKNDKVPPPFNRVPCRLLEVYPNTDPDTRREVEKLLTHTILPPAEEEESLAEDSISHLACVLIKMWSDLTPDAKATFAKLLRSKKPIRDLTHQFIKLRPHLKKNSTSGVSAQQAYAAVHQTLNQLHLSCALQNGLEQMLRVADEGMFKDLEQLCVDPEQGMELKKKVLKGVEAAVKKNADLKPLVKNMEVLLVRATTPINGDVMKGVVQYLGDVWGGSDGKRSDDMSKLLSVLVSSFPEVCKSASITKEILELTALVAESEISTGTHGGEDLDQIVGEMPQSKRQKVMTLRQRRSVLENLLESVKSLGGADKGFMECFSKSEQGKIVKTLKKLCLHTTEKVAKIAAQVLRHVAGNDSTAVFNSLCEDCFKTLDSSDIATHKAITILRVLQQSLILSPTSTKCIGQITKLMATALQALYNKEIKMKKTHSFSNPPLDCLTYKAALSVFVAYVTKLKNKEEVITNFKVLGKYCQYTHQKDDLAKKIQTVDATKAILKLGRDPEIRKMLYTTSGMPQIWTSLAKMTREQTVPQARAEIGRVLFRDITSGKLPMQFMQLLVMTLVDVNKENYLKAQERVEEAVAYFRTKCKQFEVKLEDMAAPGLSPEYIVPPLVHLLARWEFLETLAPSYEPIQRVLYVLFDKLTDRKECGLFLFDLLGRLKALDDALNPSSTNTRLICDIAYVVLKQVTNTKKVPETPFPGSTHIPNLFTTAALEHALWAETVYIDERKFVPITRKNERHNNPPDLTGTAAGLEHSGGTVPLSTGKKRSASPSKTSPGSKKAKTGSPKSPEGAKKEPKKKPSPKKAVEKRKSNVAVTKVVKEKPSTAKKPKK